MERKKLIIQKIVASLVLLVLILTHSAVVGVTAVSYAVDIIATNSNNVGFKAYFVDNGQESTQIQKGINEQDVKLNIDIAVRNEGYFNGQISFADIGFKIKEDNKSEYIEKIENNIIYLKQLNADETAKLQLAIEPIDEEEIEPQSLNANTKVLLTGTYFNSKKDVQIKGESTVNIIWTMPQGTEARLAGRLLTNSTYKVGEENKKILQFLVLSKVVNNNYPVKNTEILATVPQGVQKVVVHKRTTNATNGDKEFSETNYKVESNLLKINVANNEVNGKISWKKNTQDTYVVTYEFKDGTDLSKENISINSNLTMYNADQAVLKAPEQKISLKDESQGIVSLEKKEKEKEIYKGKIYSGEERDYTTYTKICVDYAEGTKQLKLQETEPVYKNKENDVKANIEYKEIKLNKQNVNSVLGDIWEMSIIYSGVDEITLTNETQADANGDIVLKFKNGTRSYDIITSEVKNNGIITIEETKTIKGTNYKREEIKALTSIQNKSILQYKDNEGKKYESKKTSQIALKDTKTEARLEVEQKSLTSSKGQKELNIATVLKTDDENKDLYKNPKIKIGMPNQIHVVSAQTKILYANGLSLDNGSFKVSQENGHDVINITLNGEQGVYQGEAIEGAKVLVNSQVEVKEQKQDTMGEITLSYKNENATTYANEGTEKASIKLLATSAEDASEQSSSSAIAQISQDLQATLKAKVGGQEIKEGDAVKAGEIIVYDLTLTNKGSNSVENLSMNATIPEGTSLIEVNPKYPAYNAEKDFYTMDEQYLVEKTDTQLKKEKITVDAGKTITYSFMVRVKSDLTETKTAEANISISKDNNKVKELKYSNKLEQGNIELTFTPIYRKPDEVLEAEHSYMYELQLKNLTNTDQKNIQVTINKNSIVAINDLSWFVDDENWDKINKNETTFTIPSIPAKGTAVVTINATTHISQQDSIEQAPEDINSSKFSAIAKDTTQNEYRSNQLIEKVTGVKMEASMETELTQKQRSAEYLQIGDKVKYKIKVKNVGDMDANNLVIEDRFSDYLNLLSVKLNGNDYSAEQENAYGEGIDYTVLSINTQLKAGEEANIEILGEVDSNIPNKDKDIEVSNKSLIYNYGVKVAETTEIKYTIKKEAISNGDSTSSDQNNSEANNTISGVAWLDENQNGARESKEQLLAGINVYAIDIDTNKIVTNSQGKQITATTNNEGAYKLSGLTKGKYIVAFEYDTKSYIVTQYQADGISETLNSDAVKASKIVDGEERTLAFTDSFNVNGEKLNIDLGLIKAKIFDLELEKVITKATIANEAGTKVKEFKDTNLAKIEIRPKYVEGTNVTIEYKIKVKNNGEVAGYAKNIVDYLPSSLTFKASLNKDWYQDGNYIYNKSLADTKIQPGETKELTLILTKTMTETNTGLTHNTAEIVEDYNSMGIEDKDSKVGNKNTEEDDMGSADIIISVSTGKVITYIGVTIFIIAIIGCIYYYITKKIKN